MASLEELKARMAGGNYRVADPQASTTSFDEKRPQAPASDAELVLSEGPSGRLGTIVSADVVKQAFGNTVRFNTLTEKVEVLNKQGVWEAWDHKRISYAYLDLSERVAQNVDKQVAADKLNMLALDNKFDPIKDYFQRCYEQVEPDWHTYHHLIDRFYGKSSTPYANEIMRGWLLAIVARVFKPAFYYRHCPALCGPKKIGKGALKGLVPVLSDTVLGIAAVGRRNMPPTIDQMVYVGKSSLILEISEINGLVQCRDTNMEDLKTYFSEPDLAADFKQVNSEKVRRTWNDYGSSNVTEFMHPEMVGRVLPISLNHLKPNEFYLKSYNAIDDFRDGMWSAAMHDFMANYSTKSGFSYSPEMEEEFNRQGEGCSAESKWEKITNTMLNFGERVILSSSEVTDALREGGETNPPDIGKFMREHNWIEKPVRVSHDAKGPNKRWVHANRYEMAGTNANAIDIDAKAKAGIDKDACTELRLSANYGLG